MINFTGGLLPPSPVDLEAQRGRLDEDARWQPHRPHDDHQCNFSFIKSTFFIITFIIFINNSVLERGQIGQDPVHQEVLQGDFVNDGDDDDLCKLV